MRRIRTYLLGVVVGLALAAVGCGPATVVKGTVTLDGAPVTEGSIVFAPATGGGATAGGRVANGAFEITDRQGLTPGPKTVTLRVAVKTGRQVAAGPPFPAGTMIDEVVYFPAPTERNDYSESRQVGAGVSVLDFELKSKGTGKTGK
jgi:hypothetical protein